MKKALFIAFTVTWFQATQRVVPCPGSFPMTDTQEITYVTACITNESRPMSAQFKTADEAKKFLEAMKTLHLGERFEMKEVKN